MILLCVMVVIALPLVGFVCLMVDLFTSFDVVYLVCVCTNMVPYGWFWWLVCGFVVLGWRVLVGYWLWVGVFLFGFVFLFGCFNAFVWVRVLGCGLIWLWWVWHLQGVRFVAWFAVDFGFVLLVSGVVVWLFGWCCIGCVVKLFGWFAF